MYATPFLAWLDPPGAPLHPRSPSYRGQARGPCAKPSLLGRCPLISARRGFRHSGLVTRQPRPRRASLAQCWQGRLRLGGASDSQAAGREPEPRSGSGSRGLGMPITVWAYTRSRGRCPNLEHLGRRLLGAQRACWGPCWGLGRGLRGMRFLGYRVSTLLCLSLSPL